MKTFCLIDNKWIDIQSDNNYIVYGKGWLNTYQDKNMNLLQNLYPAFVSCSEYSEGLMIVQGKNNKFGYMDKAGVLRSPCIYQVAYPFVNGVAIVYDGYFHVINPLGRMVIPDNYDNIRYDEYNNEYLKCFKQGINQPLIVKISDLIGEYTYPKDNIDSQMMLVTNQNDEQSFCEVPVINGFVPIIRNSMWGVQDQKGNTIVPACHKKPYFPYNSMFSFIEDNYLKIIDLTTKQYKYIDCSLYDKAWDSLKSLDLNPKVMAQCIKTGNLYEVTSLVTIDDQTLGQAKKRIK